MTKGKYFILNKKGYGSDAKIEVDTREGYIDGDFGICKSGKCWVATHIPTGLKLVEASTKQELLEQVHKRISAPEFEAIVTAAKNSKYHKMFETEKQKILLKGE